MTINNLKMRTTLWGPPDRVTISLTKNNVWDRRINTRGLTAPTLQEIIDGAYSPANKGYEGKHPETQRPRGYGYLLKEGGFYDPYREPDRVSDALPEARRTDHRGHGPAGRRRRAAKRSRAAPTAS